MGERAEHARTRRANTKSIYRPEVLCEGKTDSDVAIQSTFEIAEHINLFLLPTNSFCVSLLLEISLDEAYAADVDNREGHPVAQTYQNYLTSFAQISEEERMTIDRD
jgi:predicted proteasome-type protease